MSYTGNRIQDCAYVIIGAAAGAVRVLPMMRMVLVCRLVLTEVLTIVDIVWGALAGTVIPCTICITLVRVVAELVVTTAVKVVGEVEGVNVTVDAGTTCVTTAGLESVCGVNTTTV